MKRLFFVLVAFLICIGIRAHTADSAMCTAKEVMMAKKKANSLISVINGGSGFMNNLKSRMIKMEPEVRLTMRKLQRRNKLINWDHCTLWQDQRHHKLPAVPSSEDYQYCTADSMGNVRIWVRDVDVKYPVDSTLTENFTGNLIVTICPGGLVKDVDLVSENLYPVAMASAEARIPKERYARQYLADRSARLQTRLILDDAEGLSGMFDKALWIDRTDSILMYGMDRCLARITEGRIIPHTVEISKHLGGDFYRVSTKVSKVTPQGTNESEIVEFWDFENPREPFPLVFAWIEGDEDKTLRFNDLPIVSRWSE